MSGRQEPQKYSHQTVSNIWTVYLQQLDLLKTKKIQRLETWKESPLVEIDKKEAVGIEKTTKDSNNLGRASSIIRNGKNMSDTCGEILELLHNAIERSATWKQQQNPN